MLSDWEDADDDRGFFEWLSNLSVICGLVTWAIIGLLRK